MTTPGTFAWAIEQARAGSSIRRASWPFYWILVPVIDPPPSIFGDPLPAGSMELRYTVEFDERQPFGGEDRPFGSVTAYVIPPTGVDTETCAMGWLRAIVATDWETCSSELPCRRRGPARGFEEGDSVLMLGAGRTVGIQGTPESLAGFRKVSAFIPIDQVRNRYASVAVDRP